MTFLLIGHRGTRVGYDENTIGAFEKAINSGANIIEFDIRKTKDEKLIVFHDDNVDRMTKNSGKIKEYTLVEIKNIRTIREGEKIPLFKEVLSRFRYITDFMVELKVKGIKEEVINIIKKQDLIKETIISSRNFSLLSNIRKNHKKIRTCYNITKGRGLSLKEFLQEEIDHNIKSTLDMISLRSSQVSQDFINICHDHNILALSWDFIDYSNPLNHIKKLISMKIDGILFDNYQNISIIKDWFKNQIN